MAWSARRDVTRIGIFAFSLALVVLALPGRPQAAVAATSGCPTTLLLETTNDRDYVAVFAAGTAMSTGIDMTLFTRDGAYAVADNSIAIEKPSGRTGATAFRSAPLIISNATKEPFLGAAVHFASVGGATPCAPVHTTIHSAESQKTRTVQNGDVAVRQAVAKEANAATSEVVPVDISANTVRPQCANPFNDAEIDRFVAPNYPYAARAADITGTVEIKVTLDADGHVTDASLRRSSGNTELDGAALTAARGTKYRPARFLCKPEGGTYLYMADFHGP